MKKSTRLGGSEYSFPFSEAGGVQPLRDPVTSKIIFWEDFSASVRPYFFFEKRLFEVAVGAATREGFRRNRVLTDPNIARFTQVVCKDTVNFWSSIAEKVAHHNNLTLRSG